jgi:hypothetical protein
MDAARGDVMNNLQSHMGRFLERTETPSGDFDKAWSNSWGAAVQHNPTYLPAATSGERNQVRNGVRVAVEQLSSSYQRCVDEAAHEENISNLADDISKQFGPLLMGGRFRIGTSQKVFNLYLKFLWCFGSIPEPPHCPLDRRVQERAKLPRIIKWTGLDNISEYHGVMQTLRRNDQTLAVWELLYGW